ncbi:hypothetical protein LV779_24590 [Streptomyces thinghirensis]|nr:hypothetical protein [Streptomyces thinghirensis]
MRGSRPRPRPVRHRARLDLLLAKLRGRCAPPRCNGLAGCAEQVGARGDLPHLSDAADRRSSSGVVTQARRLRERAGGGGDEVAAA